MNESRLSSLFTNDNQELLGETNIQYLNFTSGGKDQSWIYQRQDPMIADQEPKLGQYMLVEHENNSAQYRPVLEARSGSMGAPLVVAPHCNAATNSDFESNTNFNYSESAYPS